MTINELAQKVFNNETSKSWTELEDFVYDCVNKNHNFDLIDYEIFDYVYGKSIADDWLNELKNTDKDKYLKIKMHL